MNLQRERETPRRGRSLPWLALQVSHVGARSPVTSLLPPRVCACGQLVLGSGPGSPCGMLTAQR